MALASSAVRKNAELVVDALGFNHYIRCLVTGNEVTDPKPRPEIYLKVADRLGVEPSGCVAFEDTFIGVEGAKAAGMTCVAAASTYPADELRLRSSVDLVASGFREVGLARLRGLFRKRPSPGRLLQA